MPRATPTANATRIIDSICVLLVVRHTRDQKAPLRGHSSPRLISAIALCPRYEDLGHRPPKLDAGGIVHRKVNAGPYSGITGLLRDRADKSRTRRKQISENFRASGRK